MTLHREFASRAPAAHYAAAPMRPATSHDVARVAGVSQPTVSRALRDDPRVARATRERVRAAAEQLGYVASRRGRSLSTRLTGQIAVVVSDLGNPFYMEAVAHLYAVLDAEQTRLVVLTEPPDGAPLTVEQVADGGIDGVIVTTTLLGSSLPAQLAERGLPTVLLNRAVDDAVVDVCESENAAGARLVAEQLLDLGHRAIGAIFGPADTSTGRDREAAFRDALAARGAALSDALVRRGPFSHEAGHRGLCELMADDERPTAIFCANDVIALGTLNAARGMGVAVPAELTVFGFDDIEMAAWEVYRLSTIRQDLAALAAAAVRMLRERIADPGLAPRRERIPTQLVLRASHAPPAS
jgi:LacI family transcriptional regulator